MALNDSVRDAAAKTFRVTGAVVAVAADVVVVVVVEPPHATSKLPSAINRERVRRNFGKLFKLVSLTRILSIHTLSIGEKSYLCQGGAWPPPTPLVSP